MLRGVPYMAGNDSNDDPLNSWRNWLCFWLLGTLNNFSYVVILCGAKSLATKDFTGASNMTGLINWALVAMGLLARGSNAFYLENVSSRKRTLASVLLFTVGTFGLALSPLTKQFIVAIIR